MLTEPSSSSKCAPPPLYTQLALFVMLVVSRPCTNSADTHLRQNETEQKTVRSHTLCKQVPMPYKWRKSMFLFLSNSPIVSRGIYGMKVGFEGSSTAALRPTLTLHYIASLAFPRRSCSCA